jgi:hypothetical protein
MMEIKKISLILFVFLFYSCGTEWGKYGGYKLDYDSDTEYYIALDKIDTILKDYPYYNKGSFIKYHNNDNSIDTVFVGCGARIIEPFIDSENVSFDNHYILVLQKPLDIIFGKIDLKPYPHRENNPTLETIEKSTIIKYWIIDKAKDNIYGPFDRNDYIKKKHQLKIPKQLKLDVE